MAYSYKLYNGDGTNKIFPVTVPYIEKAHVKVYVDGVEVNYEWLHDGSVTLETAPAQGSPVKIQRVTPRAERLVDFQNGTNFTEQELDNSALQLLYIVQETFDAQTDLIQVNDEGRFDALGKVITNAADPINPQDVATRHWVENVGPSSVTTAVQAAADAETAQAAAENARDAAESFSKGHHNDLTNRDASDAHPIAAITGLQAALDGHTHTVAQITNAGTASTLDAGTAPGNVPVLDAEGKLAESVLPGGLNVAPQTVLAAPTGSKISGWADGDQDAPVLSLHTASDIGDTYYSAERVDASLAAGEVGVAAGIVVAYAWEGSVHQSSPSPSGLSLDLSGAADGVYHIYADLNEEGSWAGAGYSALYPAYGTARLTPGSDLYNTATVRMYDGADTEVRRVYIGRVEMVGGVPTSVVEAPIGTSVKIPLGSGTNITNGTTYVESNPFSSSASIELEYYVRTRASSTDIRWQRVDSAQYNSTAARYYGSAPSCVNSDVAIISTGNWALAPYNVYFDGVNNCPGRIKLTRGF